MTEGTIRTLIIEDNPDDLVVIRRLLTAKNGLAFDVKHCDELSDGLTMLDGHAFDIVLLDLTLPDSVGIDTCTRARAAAGDTPIVVLTGLDANAVATEALKHGAQDYMVKGKLDRDSLVRSMQYAIERSQRNRIERELRGVQSELHVARQIQEGLLPRAAPQIAGYDFAGMSLPAEAVSGDYYDYIGLGPGRIAVAVADASGHGLGPAMLANEARACLRALMHTHDDPAHLLTTANALLSDGMLERLFISMLLLRIDASARRVTYASAGHPAGYVIAADGLVRRELTSTGFPLGVQQDDPVRDGGTLTLEPGESLFLLTDGAIEALNVHNEAFGVERTLDVLRAHHDKCAAETLDELREAVRAHCAPNRPADDVTAVMVKVLPS